MEFDLDEHLEHAKSANEDGAFTCLDCSINTYAIQEYYMVHFELWDQFVPEHEGMLCIGCLESRIDRILTASDFLPVLINTSEGWFYPHSERLYRRLTDDL